MSERDAIVAWREAVRAGDDYPCPYWGVVACAYHNHGGCDCDYLKEYRAIERGDHINQEISDGR